MKQHKTELVFLLDRSGSMLGLEKDTIGGFNAMLERQKQEPGEVTVTTVLFDHETVMLHDRMALQAISPLTGKDYEVRGSTALLDAMGSVIHHVARSQRRTLPTFRADKVLFVIITDGYENASRHYRYEEVRALIEKEKTRYGWEFLFLGANIDAMVAAGRFGIDPGCTADYHADSEGVRCNYESLNRAVSQVRQECCLHPDWKAPTEADYYGRKGK